jgi:predicted small secreted protein
MNKPFWTRLAMVLAAAFITMTVTACETTEGAGRDIEKAGDAIKDAAD